MKKTLLIVLVLLVILLSGTYVFIPGKIRISCISSGGCIPKNISDCLNEFTISRWWPEQAGKKTDSLFFYKDYDYTLTNVFTDGAEIQIRHGKDNFSTRIMTIPTGKDSSIVEWQASFISSLNPFARINQYQEATRLKENMQELLDSLLSFAVKTKNIYGFHIERTTFTDTILFATRFVSPTYPSVSTIYHYVDALKKKIKEAGAIEKDYPMLHVNQKDSMGYETMIAICVNKEIPAETNFFVSRMVPMKDRFLKVMVTGGDSTIQQAHQAIRDYMSDRFLSAPAISFEILTTDRSKETDTSERRTIIFQPTM